MDESTGYGEQTVNRTPGGGSLFGDKDRAKSPHPVGPIPSAHVCLYCALKRRNTLQTGRGSFVCRLRELRDSEGREGLTEFEGGKRGRETVLSFTGHRPQRTVARNGGRLGTPLFAEGAKGSSEGYGILGLTIYGSPGP
jgi:hypothetical protein